jgi:hypothetical protein
MMLYKTSITNPVKEKIQMVVEALKAARPYATDVEVTGEDQPFNWKSPTGFGWSKTSDLKIAIAGCTKRLHVVFSTGTSNMYYYK